jgi:hypothetical protein
MSPEKTNELHIGVTGFLGNVTYVFLNLVIEVPHFITQSSFKVLFRNTNHVTDQISKLQDGARLEPAVHSVHYAVLQSSVR